MDINHDKRYNDTDEEYKELMLGGISRKLAYKLLSEKEIHSVRVGRTYKIPKVCIMEYLLGEEMCHIKIF